MKTLLFLFQQVVLELKERIIVLSLTLPFLLVQLLEPHHLTPTDDSVYEGNETGIVAISGVSGADAAEDGTQSVTITITENESAPTVTLQPLQPLLQKTPDHL